MKRAYPALGVVGVVVSLAGLVVSCGAKEPGSVTPTPGTSTAVAVVTAAPTASSSVAPEAKPNLNDPAQVSASSWTDDDAIAGLAKDCNWDPGNCLALMHTSALTSMDSLSFLPEGMELPEGDNRKLPPEACKGLWPLSCAHVPSQSCAPDECSQSDYDCVPACDKSCSSCAGKCVSGCESCKSGCKDDACKLECAKKCGECRQTCVQELDRCSSAGCAEQSETCFKERDDQWTKSTCPKVCPKVQACVEKCPEIENDWTGQRYYSDCAKKCLDRLGKGCPPRFNAICAGHPDASVNFFAYRSSREAAGVK